MKGRLIKDHIHTLLRREFTSLKGQRHRSHLWKAYWPYWGLLFQPFLLRLSPIYPELCQDSCKLCQTWWELSQDWCELWELCQDWWDHTSRMRWDRLSWIIICSLKIARTTFFSFWWVARITFISRSLFQRDFRLNLSPLNWTPLLSIPNIG